MPYSLRGTSVVKSDSGEVVKRHPSREKALAHLRALKANVEESVLDSLLEGFLGRFDPAKHPRGAHGRWAVGDLVKFNDPRGGIEREGQITHIDPVTEVLKVQTGVNAHPTLARPANVLVGPVETFQLHPSKVEAIKQWSLGRRGLRKYPLHVDPVGK